MNQQEAGRLGAIASRKTQDRLKRERIAKYDKNPILCKLCGKPLSYKCRTLTFCSRTCSATYNNIHRGARSIETRIRISNGLRKPENELTRPRLLSRIVRTGNCANCGTETTNAKFCNEKCSGEYKWKQTKISIEKNNGNHSQPLYRKYFLEKCGNVCKLCGNTEWQGQPIPLVLDHIDGNSDNMDLSNMRLICHNCDALLPTFAGRNRNSARKYRRDAYKRKYC